MREPRGSSRKPESFSATVLVGLIGIALFYSPPNLIAGKTTAQLVTRSKTALQSSAISAIEDLAGRLRDQQDMFMIIMPPGGGFTLKQSAGMVVFDPKAFPDSFTSGLIGEQIHDSPVYTITLAEDPNTHETVIANADGKEIAAINPESGYNPWWLLEMKYPGLYSGLYSEDEIKRLQDEYDPSHIQVTLTLLPADYVDAYSKALAEEQTQLIEEQAVLALKSPKSKFGGGMMMYQGSGLTNFFMDIVQVTNGMKVTLAYPSDYTNRVDFFTCSDLKGFWWDLAVSATNVSTSTNFIEWVDVNSSAQTVRFYAAGNADWDTDGDGLKDAREKFLYHTNASMNDSDGDGLTDYYEIFTSHTDPNNGDTNKPNVWITFPATNTVEVWEP